MEPTVAIIIVVVVVVIVIIGVLVTVSKSTGGKHTNSEYASNIETPAQTRYRELKLADEARNRALAAQRAIEEKEKEKNAQLERDRDKARKLSEFRSRFRCQHIDGCNFVSPGPEPYQAYHYGGSGDSEVSYYYDALSWDTPRDMICCVKCRKWFCKKHIARMDSWKSHHQDIEYGGPEHVHGYCYACENARMEG